MGRASIKSNGLISLPHNGPLYYFWSDEQDHHDGVGVVLQTALAWLASSHTGGGILLTKKTDQPNNEATKMLSLVSLLLTANTIKEQLRALQNFQSQCSLPQRKQQNPSSSDESDTHIDQDIYLYQTVLYRILLE
jgi:hypothetical protein